MGGVALGLLAVTALFVAYGSDPNMPNLRAISDYHPHQVSRVLDRNGVVIGELGTEKRTFVPYASIPKVLVNAVIAAEDASFFQHSGLDVRGILRAFIENVIRGRTAQGGSTITQQVVKRLLLTPERTLKRKVQEIILSYQLSKKLTKQDILEIYLNEIYYGHGRYGCEEAARFFFGKPVAKIDVAEAALLAGLPQSPERLSPLRHEEAAKTRQRYVLGRMADLGFITPANAEALARKPIAVAREATQRLAAPEVVDSIARQLADKYGAEEVARMGVEIKTTIDARIQTFAREAVERGLEELDGRQQFRGPSGHLAGKALEHYLSGLRKAAGADGPKPSAVLEGVVQKVEPDAGDARRGRLWVDVGAANPGVVDLVLETRYQVGSKPLASRFTAGDLVRVRVAPERRRGDGKEVALALELGPQAAMVVLDPATGDVLALVGGYGYRPGGFDRSQRAHRQPGSAFKPFLYATAIDSKRYTAATRVNDAPEVYALWKPQNYEREEFRGPVRLRTALAHSINTVAIKLMSDLGLPAVRDIAVKAGITSPIDDALGLSLALGSLTVTPLELAAAYAPFANGGRRVEAHTLTSVGGNAVEVKPPTPALRPETAYVITAMMKSVVEEGTARAASAKLRRPIAGKTGTSNDQKDAWFVGYAPDLLAAVWVGFDDTKKLGKGEAGGRTALPIWTDLMTKALANHPVRDFAQPAGVEVRRIDPATGLLAAPGTDGIEEVFIEGTAPTELASPGGEDASADKLLLQH